METISIDRLLSALLALAVSFGLLWLLSWLITRPLERLFASRPVGGGQPSVVEVWAARLTLFLRRVTEAVSLVRPALAAAHAFAHAVSR